MNRNKKILTAILVLLVICTGISISYAFFKVASSNNGANTNVTINGAALCMSLQQTSENVTLSNEYAVPISDSKALSTDTYKTSVTIENNCSTSQSFNLLLVPNSSNTMPIKALKSFFGDDSVTVSTSGVLISEEYILDSTIQKQLLSLKNETLKTGFAVGGGTVSANTSKTFYLYLWIDKDEGGLGNGSTMNKSLNAYLTLGSGSTIGEKIVGKSFQTVFVANNSDIFDEKGIRYEGADPNNYICLDNKTSGGCSDSSLLFRIIGLFDEDSSNDGTTSNGSKKLLKVIDTNSYGGEGGKVSGGPNDWSSAPLKTELNETYLNTLLETSNINGKLSSGIANAKWHLGGASSSNYKTLVTEDIYTLERNTSAIYSGNTSSIYAKVGLMYPSDYGYATIGGSMTTKSDCRALALYNWGNDYYADCKDNDWLFTSQKTFSFKGGEWLLSPCSSNPNTVSNLRSTGFADLNGVVGHPFSVRPTFYLDSSILQIVGTGDGTKDNAYRLG